MYTTFGAPSGALGGSNGVQSGTESRISTLTVPLKGSPTTHLSRRPPGRVLPVLAHRREQPYSEQGAAHPSHGVTLRPRAHGGELVLDAGQQLMIGIAERADALALQLGGHGAQVEPGHGGRG